MTTSRQRRGALGEDRAAAWYAAHGYQVVARNWRSRTGEIDLVARRGRLLVVCEVKTRTGTAYGSPAEAVTAAKRRRLRRLAAEWLAVTGTCGVDVRFDVAAVTGRSLEILEGAF